MVLPCKTGGAALLFPEYSFFRGFLARGYNSRLCRLRRVVEAFLVSTGIVALAEIGDKTQLLALMLAARYRRPVPVILGILTASLANHPLVPSFATGLPPDLEPA